MMPKRLSETERSVRINARVPESVAKQLRRYGGISATIRDLEERDRHIGNVDRVEWDCSAEALRRIQDVANWTEVREDGSLMVWALFWGRDAISQREGEGSHSRVVMPGESVVFMTPVPRAHRLPGTIGGDLSEAIRARLEEQKERPTLDQIRALATGEREPQ